MENFFSRLIENLPNHLLVKFWQALWIFESLIHLIDLKLKIHADVESKALGHMI